MTLTSNDATAGAAASSYQLDSSASRFTVHAFAGGILSALGHSPTLSIRDFSGEIGFNPMAPDRATLRMEIRADSLEVMDDIKSSDRREMQDTMNREILQVSKYPTIAFGSTSTSVEKIGDGLYKAALKGNLTLRGVTRGLPLVAHLTMAGNQLIRASGEFSILQSDYGIEPVSVAGGALKLKDELKFSFDIVARKQA